MSFSPSEKLAQTLSHTLRDNFATYSATTLQHTSGGMGTRTCKGILKAPVCSENLWLLCT